ncbi:hypothetical protein MPSEU_000180600 [Mayamaea pseudoterrestris]|nr:hypothetical protein MPSEU_000180600 [Mayamaea pseudoterrestris]
MGRIFNSQSLWVATLLHSLLVINSFSPLTLLPVRNSGARAVTTSCRISPQKHSPLAALTTSIHIHATRQPSRLQLSAQQDAFSSTSTTSALKFQLEDSQVDFCRGYLNKHHADFLLKIVEFFSPLGAEMANANVWSGSSYILEDAKIIDLSCDQMHLQVNIVRRNKERTTETVLIDMNADPIPQKMRSISQLLPPVPDYANQLPIDVWTRRLVRFCWMLPSQYAPVTGKILQLALQLGGSHLHKLRENLYLNQVPHNVYVRQYFYDMAKDAVVEAVLSVRAKYKATSDNANIDATSATNVPFYFSSNRLLVTCQFPELNTSMDSYRIGTLLELVRTMALALATQHGLRVRVCVQGSMGVGIFTGTPKSLSGVQMLLQRMDWQSLQGETHEGIVGTLINFGGVGPEHVVDELVDPKDGTVLQHADDVFILLCPQSMVGIDCSITPLLEQMVNKAGDRPVILVNPDLVDKPSSAGQQSVRGRQARLDFASSFETAFCFQNVYISGTSYFPILGAVTKLHPAEPWIAHQRRDYLENDADDDSKGEVYVPVLASETRPTGEAILEAFGR